VLAQPQLQPRLVPSPYVTRKRVRRARRNRRKLHRPVALVFTLVCAVLVPLLAYVTLTANLTSLNYALARETHEKTALVEETQRLDDRIVQLTSAERLANLATGLKMHDPHVYAVVSVPQAKPPQPRPTGFALLGSWFNGTSTR
jgi:cell division protein FtsL